MADTKIHDLTDGTAAATDEVPVAITPFASGDNRKLALSALDTYFSQTTKTLTNKTIDLTSNTLILTSLQLKTALTDETGSGAAVFATTPTLTTPVLGAATATSVTASGLLQAGTTLGISTDVLLNRDAANTLAQRNGATAQKLSVYNTFTDASNYERGIFDWAGSANVLSIGTEAAGTGSTRNLRFLIGGVNKLDYGVTSSASWTSQGNFHALGTYFFIGNGSDHVAFSSTAAGVLTLLDNGGSTWDRLQLGGTSSNFPAIARDGAGIKFVGADGTSVSWMKVPGVTVANLPAAATAGAGACSFVTDASTTLILGLGGTVTGGGSNKVPVYSDGANWIYG